MHTRLAQDEMIYGKITSVLKISRYVKNLGKHIKFNLIVRKDLYSKQLKIDVKVFQKVIKN